MLIISFMDIQNLQAFVHVADTGSFSRAGESLHLTQPAISKRVAALETQLQASLFDRIGRQVALTEAGRALLPRARRILLELQDTRRALSRLGEQVSGPLIMGTSHHLGLHRLPPVLREFTLRYPEVDLDIRFMESEAAAHAVERGDLELAVITLPLQPAPSLATRCVWPDPLVVAVAADHPLAKHPAPGATALGGWPCILPDHSTYTRILIDTAFADLGVTLQPRLSTNYLETIRMLVSIGIGWGMLPQSMVGDSLVTLTPPGIHISRELGVVRHRERSLSRAGEELLGLLGVPAAVA